MPKGTFLSCTGNRHLKFCFNNGLEVFSQPSDHVFTWTHTDTEIRVDFERDFEMYLLIKKLHSEKMTALFLIMLIYI